MGLDDLGDRVGEPGRERRHLRERGVGEHVLQRGSRGGDRQRVPRESPTHPAHVDQVQVIAVENRGGQLGGQAVRPDGHASADGLADGDDVRHRAVAVLGRRRFSASR
jgi:hypothetical protein